MNFIDITAYKKLEEEKENHALLKNLNTTVHHEMLAPLLTNIQICQRLKILTTKQQKLKLLDLMLVSSQMILMHVNDLLDWRIIESGGFAPNMTVSPINCAIEEMIDLMNSTLVNRDLTIVK